jgi:hypothetical protein
MNNSNTQFGNANFTLYYNFRDRFQEKQINPERIGDIGEVSEKFKENARTQYKASSFHDLAANPKKYVAPELYGTDGRDDNRNYNRMEYDPVVRHDDKSHSDVMKTLDSTRDKVIKELSKGRFAWDINNFDYAVGTDPITMEDYGDDD